MNRLRDFIFLSIFKREEINGDGLCPTYLYRWTLLRVGTLFSVYLHKFVGDDWSLDMHDHPKRFVSIGIKGGYIEHSPRVLIQEGGSPWRPFESGCRCAACYPHEMRTEWRAPWVRTFPAYHIHRLTGPTPDRPCWTLVIVGRIVRPWGFWRGLTWVPWRQYVNSADAAARKSCP
jgi:hypothetical protein